MKTFKLKLGATLVGLIILLALLAPFLSRVEPDSSQWDQAFHGPSWEHPLGQDEEGRDVLARVLYGARWSLGIGIVVVFLTLSLGTCIGLVAAYFGGFWEQAFIFVGDILLAFPSILLVIALAAFIPPSVFNIVLVLSAVGWVSYGRLMRSQVLSLRKREYVQAALSLGASHFRVMFRHILPNSLGPLMINATLSIAGVIIAESTLSFLGLGVPSGVASWGSMLDAGVAYLLIAPHLSIVPGMAIMFTVLAFNFLGDGLRDYYDVRGKV